VIEKFKVMIDWLIRSKDGHIHLVQIPNVPIAGWFIFMIASDFTVVSPIRTGLSNLSLAFLAIWSYLEITQGTSRFRQILGIVVGVLVVRCFF
jgi:hypothetical protein